MACAIGALLLVLVIGGALGEPAYAEDLKSRWYFGGNVSFLSTTDYIRSNASIIFTNSFGDDGIPFTGDPNELQGCGQRGSGSFSQNPFCDPRPDDLLARETAIEETVKLDVTAGFGITSWLSLQLDGSYFKGDVGPIDAFLRDSYPVGTNPVNPTALNVFRDREVALPITAGEITEIPVSLTGVVRFRKDSPLNPYIGAGAGMIFAEMDVADEVGALNTRLASMRIRGIGTETGKDITPASAGSLRDDGRVPFTHPIEVNVEDAFEWHVVGGAEYFFNDKVSLVFDARYTFADQDVTIGLGGEDQIDLIIYSERLFRSDGSLLIFNESGKAPNTFCRDTPVDANGHFTGFKCFVPGQPENPEARVTCDRDQVGDWDKDGHLDDLCYGANTAASTSGVRTPDGFVVVQGGEIDLTGFAVAVGMRFHF